MSASRFCASDIANDDIHVVSIALDDYGDGTTLAGLLDDEERERAARFVYPIHRRRFIVSHAMLRVTLGRLLGTAPGALSFTVGAFGKPAIAGGGLEFNLSHSGERALVAVARGGPIGVDVEEVHVIDTMGIASRFFSALECDALAAARDDDRTAAFFRCWTRKESFVKARGDGLSCPLDQFDVSLAPDVANALIQCRFDGITPASWSIVPLPMDGNYLAAVTAGRALGRIVRWSAPEI